MTVDARDEAPESEPTAEETVMRTRPNQAERAYFTLGWCVWTLSSSVSIVTSKIILLIENYHYPLHLLLVYLLVAALGSTCRTVRYHGRLGVAFSAPSWKIIWKSRKYRGPFEILGITCTAISLPLGVQAVTHFWNIVTLAMICMVAMPAEAGFLRICSLSMPSGTAAGTIFMGLVAGAAVLGDEYRLTVNGLVFILITLVLTGAAKAFFVYDKLRNDSRDSKSGPNFTFQQIVWLAFVVTACWTIPMEGFWAPITNIVKVNPFLLILNVISSAAAIVTGGSTLYRLPVHMPSRGRTVFTRVHTLFTLSAMVCLTCLCSAFSVLSVGRSYTSGVQLFCYVILITSAGYAAFYNFDEVKLLSPDAATHEMLLREEAAFDLKPEFASPKSKSKVFPKYRSHVGGTHAESASLFILVLAASCLLGWMPSNFGLVGSRVIPNPPPTLDTKYVPETDLDIVVNMYKEPLSHIKSIVKVLKATAVFPRNSYRLILYTKDEHADVAAIKKASGAYNVTKLPNVGREGETYLRHITEQWDHLAKHTMFIQADVHNVREFRPRFRDYFDPSSTGMLSLGFSGIPCDCHDCGDRWGWHDSFKLVPKVYRDVYGPNVTCSRALLSYKGQFLASARRIRGVKKEVYQRLWEAFVDPKSWAHGKSFLKGHKEKMSAPYIGYAVERLWGILMQCSDLEVAWECPTLLSRNRRGGSKADCQCFDELPRDG